MPSNQTQNYELSQWEKSDQVLMDDFNADNRRIDAALKTQADALAAEKTAREAAVAAEAAARTALDAAVSKLGNCRVEYFTADLSLVDGAGATVKFSALPEVFFMVGNSFLIGSRRMTYMRRFYSATSSLSSGSVTVTWSGNSCKLGTGINGVHSVFAFYRMDQ